MSSPEEYIDNITAHLVSEFELSQEQIDEVLPLFVETIQSHMKELEECLQDSDFVAMKKVGHTMKGALLNLGVNDLADLASQIELYPLGTNGNNDCKDIVESLKVKINHIQVNQSSLEG